MNPTIATADGNGTVSILSTGVATFRASQDGNQSFNPAPTVDQTLTINKVLKRLLSPYSELNLSAGTYTLVATASSNLGVSFASGNSTMASISVIPLP